MGNNTGKNLEELITEWRGEMSKSAAFSAENLAELEVSLRDSLDVLRAKGLSDDEAFLIAVRRIGSRAALEPEFLKINPGAIWRSRLGWAFVGIIGSMICSQSVLLAQRIVVYAGTESRWVGEMLGMEWQVRLSAVQWAGLIASSLACGAALYAIWRLMRNWDSFRWAKRYEQSPAVQIAAYIVISTGSYFLNMAMSSFHIMESHAAFGSTLPFPVPVFAQFICWHLPLLALAAFHRYRYSRKTAAA